MDDCPRDVWQTSLICQPLTNQKANGSFIGKLSVWMRENLRKFANFWIRVRFLYSRITNAGFWPRLKRLLVSNRSSNIGCIDLVSPTLILIFYCQERSQHIAKLPMLLNTTRVTLQYDKEQNCTRYFIFKCIFSSLIVFMTYPIH